MKRKELKLALVVWFGWLHSIQSRLHFNHKLIEAGLIERTRQPTQTNQTANQLLSFHARQTNFKPNYFSLPFAASCLN